MEKNCAWFPDDSRISPISLVKVSFKPKREQPTPASVIKFWSKGCFCLKNRHKYHQVKLYCASLKIDPNWLLKMKKIAKVRFVPLTVSNWRHPLPIVTWWRIKHKFCSQAFTELALTQRFVQLLDGWWRLLVVGEGFDNFGDRFANKCLDKFVPSV